MSWAHIFSGSFGSVVNRRTKTKPKEPACLHWWMVKSGPVFCSLAQAARAAARKTSLLNICAVKEGLSLNILFYLCESVVSVHYTLDALA